MLSALPASAQWLFSQHSQDRISVGQGQAKAEQKKITASQKKKKKGSKCLPSEL